MHRQLSQCQLSVPVTIAMEVLLLIAVIAIAVWSVALLQLPAAGSVLRFVRQLNPVYVIALAAIVTGIITGYELLHLDVGPIPVTVDRLFAGAMAVLFVACVWMQRESVRKMNRMDLAVIVATLMLGFSVFFTNDFRFRGFTPVSRFLFFHLLPAAIYFVVRNVRIGSAEIRLTIAALSVVGGYLALTAVAETRDAAWLVYPSYIMSPDFPEFLGRGRGPLLNPVSNGILMVVALFCGLMCWRRDQPRRQILITVFAIVMVAGIHATLTRSIWATLFCIGGLVIWFRSDQATRGKLVIVGTLAAILLFPVIGHKLTSFKRDKEVSVADMEKSAQLRPLFLTVAWRMFQDRPMLGVGLGHYPIEKYPYLQDPTSRSPLSATRGYEQHNVFLAYLTETGLVGTIPLLIMLTLMFRISWRLYHDPTAPDYARRAGGLGCAMTIAYIMNGLFHDVSVIPMSQTMLLFTAGLVTNMTTRGEVIVPVAVQESSLPRDVQERLRNFADRWAKTA